MHTIHLRGPWQLEPVARFVPWGDGRFETRADELPAACRQKQVPAEWSAVLGADFLGRVVYRRSFQTPTGLGPRERVWLVVEPPRTLGTVRLGDETLGEVRVGQPAARFEITERLADRNRLEITVEHPELNGEPCSVDDVDHVEPGGLVGEVRLEIVVD